MNDFLDNLRGYFLGRVLISIILTVVVLFLKTYVKIYKNSREIEQDMKEMSQLNLLFFFKVMFLVKFDFDKFDDYYDDGEPHQPLIKKYYIDKSSMKEIL